MNGPGAAAPYGARRVHAVLTRSDDPRVGSAGLDLVRDIMRQEGLVAAPPRRWTSARHASRESSGSVANCHTADTDRVVAAASQVSEIQVRFPSLTRRGMT
ncbi:transposase [Ornithinimicrobium avium]|uniref:Transposase n=1 Tax=Ornithinimicrobium avium TaxID=2283195 RepID=A0A345NLP2_9MICO|nr:transposase [Ornithinimicrobium avium]